MDENVHFTHTTTLISELISAGKPYDLQVAPFFNSYQLED
jgi:dipeptidyl aminopeptidase/acylaminoacyl peptidase